jgi:hypothetical protein
MATAEGTQPQQRSEVTADTLIQEALSARVNGVKGVLRVLAPREGPNGLSDIIRGVRQADTPVRAVLRSTSNDIESKKSILRLLLKLVDEPDVFQDEVQTMITELAPQEQRQALMSVVNEKVTPLKMSDLRMGGRRHRKTKVARRQTRHRVGRKHTRKH